MNAIFEKKSKKETDFDKIKVTCNICWKWNDSIPAIFIPITK
jgi:hypothetical protein